MIPLLSPKALADYSPEEFQQYIRSLYVAPAERKIPVEVSISLNKKGTPVLRISREPKFLLASEVTALAAEIGWPLQALWINCLKKKITIKLPERPKRK